MEPRWGSSLDLNSLKSLHHQSWRNLFVIHLSQIIKSHAYPLGEVLQCMGFLLHHISADWCSRCRSNVLSYC